MRILVTGGAGFIGSNFVHYVAREHRPLGHRARQAHLRRQPRLPRRPARRSLPLRQGRHPRRGARRRALRRARRGGALRGREPQRQLAREPAAVPRHQHHRHVHAARGGAQARHPLPPHLDRRGLRRPRARRPGEVHRADALQPVEPVLVDEGRQRPARARLGALVRREGDDLQLLEQLRSVPARREVHPPPDHERPARRAPEALRHGRERARLDPRERPLLGRADHPRYGSHRRDVSHRRRRRDATTRRSSSSSSPSSASRPTRTTMSIDRPGPRPAVRHRLDSPAHGARVGRRSSRTSRRASPTPSRGTATTRHGGRRRRTRPRPATGRRGSDARCAT